MYLEEKLNTAPRGLRAAARPVVTGASHSLPATRTSQDDLWREFFLEHYNGKPIARRIFENSGISSRSTAVDPRTEKDVSGWSTGRRMARYIEEALPLGKRTVAAALESAGLAPEDVGLLAVTSCTGYTTPGLDLRLADELGMSSKVQRLFIGHMGCYAAVPSLGAVSDFVASRARPAVLLCLELTSLHVQPPTDDIEQIVAHALFADAAAAIVIEPDATDGHEVVDVVAVTDHSTADHMSWEITDLGFKMGLSPKVPDVLAQHVGEVIRDQLLAPHGLTPEDVGGWAIHPGGKRIVEVVGERLELPAEALRPSYEVLDEYGNCSSPTVLMVLQRLPRTDRPVVALAFGPGLTLYAALLRRPA
ncbi:3-oxoacyl-[acyl-carrier-protein] synthase III C-terminal domain-containing protein [Streptomyces sp. GC420]|uniref:type III polyketide synthase n=1 Tax=Streptomyces sp. GC420 TaxID=2697568 RepID=UPI001414D5E6|nr:3-oxoacyl-[acyl-carrier-protein] synthase III C-terminal domain-containing protein [Streptomyces sp. GC420]NBM20008.1 type III polyketide synthase [Streptomyces sp. GC420]